jgi:hypothetical protein
LGESDSTVNSRKLRVYSFSLKKSHKETYSKSFLITIVTKTEIGTANNIPINHNTDHPINTHKKINNGLTPRDLFISIGMRILFSIHCTTKYAIPTTTNHFNPYKLVATITAGIAQMIGQIYGINSVKPAINANAHIFGNAKPNNDKISNTTYTTIAI